MEKKTDRVLVISQDRFPEGRSLAENIAGLLESADRHAVIVPSAAVSVPDLNAADIIIFTLYPEPADLASYGEAFEALSGMNCAGRLGGIVLSAHSPFAGVLEEALREAGMTLLAPLVLEQPGRSGGASDGALSAWLDRLLKKRKEMIDARRSPAR